MAIESTGEDLAKHAGKMAKKKAARDKIMATKTDKRGLVIGHTGKGKGKAVAASAATDDEDDVVIVKVILASEQDHTRTATAGGAAGTTAGVLARVSVAAFAAGVLGYTDDEGEGDVDDGEEWDEWDGDE